MSPEDFKLLNRYLSEENDANKLYKYITANSIDYVMMEKSKNIKMLKTDFIWDDVGNWDALFRLQGDLNGNVLKGNIKVKEVRNSIIISDRYQINVKNLSDFIFVENNNKCLISSVKGLCNIKKVLEKFDGKKMYKSKNIDMKNFGLEYMILNISNIIISMTKMQIEIGRSV